MQSKTRIITVLVVILFFTLSAWAAIYTWKDKDGNNVVSSSPPAAGVGAEKVGEEKESVQTEENKPEVKQQGPTLRSKGLIPLPPRSTEGAQPDQKRVSREQRSYSDIKVTMYRTEWCPYCKKANELLSSLRVNLTEYDIEQDRDKAEEMQNKGGKGVPLVDVEGIIIKGYDADAIKQAVEKKRNGG
jgi:glutaredoxin